MSTASAVSIRRDVAEMLRPPRRISVSEAATEYLRVVDGSANVVPWSAATTPYMIEPMNCLASRRYDAVIFVGPARSGKALDVDTPIATPDGWTTMGALRVGDTVFGENGRPTRVIFATEYQLGRPCYEIEFMGGEKIVADDDHLWTVERFYWRAPIHRVENRTTQEIRNDYILSRRANGRTRYRYRVRLTAPIECDPKELPIDPYLLGVWLGDGVSSQAYVSTHQEDADYYVSRFESAGHSVSKVRDGRNTVFVRVDMRQRLTTHCQRGHEFSAVGRDSGGGCMECRRLNHWRRKHGVDRNGAKIPPPSLYADTFLSRLHGLGLVCNKHIPRAYLRASAGQRLELLRGLMDTDGCCDKKAGDVEFTTASEEIKDGFFELATSLGLRVGVKQKKTQWVYGGKKKHGLAYRLTFPVPGGFQPFALPRKANSVRQAKIDVGYRQIVAIRPVGSRPVKCIQVDSGNSLYLAGRSMLPTHNTMALVDAWQCYCRTSDPGDMLITQITEDKAREYSKVRLTRQLNHSPEMAKRISPRAHDDNVHDKIFRDGSLLSIKWPSKNTFASSDYRYVALTDFDRLPANIGGEGDPFSLASKRTQTFLSRGMTMAESSPGVEVDDNDWLPPADQPHMFPPVRGICDWFNAGDRRKLHWQCDGCQKWYQPSLKNWSHETASPECPHCGHEPAESDKKRLNARAVWLPEGCTIGDDGTIEGKPRQTRIASFAMEGPAAAYQPWASLSAKLLAAEQTYEQTGDQEKLKTVTNTDWGVPHVTRSKSTTRSSEQLADRATVEEMKVVPAGVRFLTCTIDVQGGKHSRFVVQVHGHGMDRERWVIDRFNVKEDRGPDGKDAPTRIRPATQPEDWDVITRDILTRTYALAGERALRMPIMMIGVDTGGEPGVSMQSYNWYRRLVKSGHARRVMLIKGATHKQQTKIRTSYPESKGKAGAKGDIPLHILATDQFKDEVDSQLQRDEPGPNYLHTPSRIGRWWYDELTAEAREPDGKWRKRSSHRANEAFDLLAYDLAVLQQLGGNKIDWDNPPDWAKPWDSNPLLKDHALLVAPTRRRRPRRKRSKYLDG